MSSLKFSTTSKILSRLILYRNFSTSPQLRDGSKTELYDFHVAKGGKIVDFAGYALPVQYSDLSITQSHLHTRQKGCASLFDVSHMLQTYLTGKDAIQCFETITTADIQNLPDGSGSLTVFTNQQGGILDDLIVNRVRPDFLYIVSNAARKDHDSKLIKSTVENFKSKGKNVDVKFFDPLERSLLALQGPGAAAAFQSLVTFDVTKFYFMSTIAAEIAGVKGCRVTRCGYTGEDGFEISIPERHATHIAETLLNSKNANVKNAGLGARDSLRLEAGLCLYGNDIDTTTTPIEAALAWLVAKRRRNEKNFPGAEIILEQLKSGVTRRRVGIRMDKGPPARQGVKIFTNNTEIGEVTSGSPSPSLGGNVAMGYVSEEFKKVGTKVELKIRDKFYTAEVAKMPFTKAGYYQKPKE